MGKPRVFYSHARFQNPWGVVYRDSQTRDWFPTWSEAYSHAFTWARVSHVAADVMRELP